MSWKTEAIKGLYENVKNDSQWINLLEHKHSSHIASIHLAIFSEGLLDKLIAGQKKLESRFSSNKICPHGHVKKGDIILAKKSGGPISAVFIAGEVFSFQNLTAEKISQLKIKYSQPLGLSIQDNFWKEKSHSKYATFIHVEKLTKLKPYKVDKRDRTGWVILELNESKTLFKNDS